MQKDRSWGFWKLVSSDIKQYVRYASDFQGAHLSKARAISVSLTPSLIACFIFRLANLLYKRAWLRFSLLLTHLNHFVNKIYISPDSEIGPGLYVPHPRGVVFRGYAGEDLTLYAWSVTVPACRQKNAFQDAGCYPRLGRKVVVGAESVILGNVKIGDNVTLGAKVVVVRDVEAHSRVFVSAGPTRHQKSWNTSI